METIEKILMIEIIIIVNSDSYIQALTVGNITMITIRVIIINSNTPAWYIGQLL